MKDSLFTQCMNRSKQDRLEAEILFLVEKYAAPEFSNLDVARALWECALKRGKREGSTLFNSFLQDHLAREGSSTEVGLVLKNQDIAEAETRRRKYGYKSLEDYLVALLLSGMYQYPLYLVEKAEEERASLRPGKHEKLN